ncbi:hypothetical protein [Actinacidiphila acididurans]|uniref:Uncharacterized protein n=1 Tax=Actinacidiphila acididurans TaxID=2784346 RepID=A0ABS2U5P2_9ACTN|nr:hypothetical protein [Actinacidiphila acididurans]MBM9510041.1 hypothetical protein [Actinacidiphila acididurans]
MSTLTTARDRGDLAEAMLPVAAHLACIVHGDGGPQDIREQLAALDAAQKDALIVVLAGLTDPDQSIAATLGWLDFEEHGWPATPVPDDRTTLRQFADQHAGDTEEGDASLVDEVAVKAYLAGRRVAVTRAERLEAITRGLGAGMTLTDFDALHGLGKSTTQHFVDRERKRAAKRGEQFPELKSASAPRSFTAEEVLDMRQRVAAGATDLDVAVVYGVRRQVVQRIVSGGSHAEVGGPIRSRQKGGQRPGSREFVNSRLVGEALAEAS